VILIRVVALMPGANSNTDSSVDTAAMFEIALSSCHREWSRPGFEKLGVRLQRALLCEEILYMAASFGDRVDDVMVRRFVDAGWTFVVSDGELKGS
jgi:hypothetical protein